MEEFLLPDGEKSLQCQDSLPSLPVPKLDNTLRKYLESVKPHVTEEEFAKTSEIVKDFESGVGKTIQEAFVEKAEGQRNWLEKLWEEKAYLESRMSINPLVSIASDGPFSSFWAPEKGSQIERASMITYYVLQFWDVLRKQKLKVDRTSDKTPLCMNQYYRLLNTSRKPGAEKDVLIHHFKTEEDGDCPSHVIIICRGRMFLLNTCTSDKKFLTPPQLQKQLQRIRDKCDSEPEGPGVCALSCNDRTTWAKMYTYLEELHPDNKQYLGQIASAAFVVSIDDADPAPANSEQMITLGLGGNAKCRWADKVFGVVFSNGTSSFNNEHSPCDGVACGYLLHFVSKCMEPTKGKWQGSMEVGEFDEPQELKFHIDATITKAIEEAAQVHKKLVDSIILHQNQYKKFGKNLMKKVRIHPIAFCQLAVQLAFYKLYKKNPPTYETAGTRKFYHGRTETLRVCTKEIMEWTKVMCDESSTLEKKVDSMQAAYIRHVSNMTDCAMGRGCDRHLLALYVTALELGLEVPALFTDKAYKASGGGANFTLSTSCAGFTPASGVCAAMVQDGYGVFYNIMEESVNFNITSYKGGKDTDPHKLFDSIEKSIDELAELGRTLLGPDGTF